MDRTRRAILRRLQQDSVPGPQLAKEFGMTRAAIWKHIERLREDGVEIDTTSDGYAVASVPEYGEAAIAARVPDKYEIVYRDVVESTNDLGRIIVREKEQPTIILANEQSSGRGRLDRTWIGPPGGIYCSLITAPRLAPTEAPLITIVASVAVADALESLGLSPTIKWPNDVRVDGQKIAGILTEMQGEADRIAWMIVGIGINANVADTALPKGATSIRAVLGEPCDRGVVVESMVRSYDNFLDSPSEALDAWRARTDTLGQRVRIETPTETIVGEAVDIELPGALIIETPTERKRVLTGDCEHLRAVSGN